MSEFEVVLDSVAPKSFARGGFGVVHMADYQADEVVLKKLPMEVRTGLYTSPWFVQLLMTSF